MKEEGGELLKRWLLTILIIAVVAVSVGCADILEGYTQSESPHYFSPPERSPEERIEVSNYDELMEVMLNLITQHKDSGRVFINNYEGDINDDIKLARREIIYYNPLGVYAISKMTCLVTRFVSYHEVDISIEYQRTKQQVDSIVNVSTQRYLRTELLNIMKNNFCFGQNILFL